MCLLGEHSRPGSTPTPRQPALSVSRRIRLLLTPPVTRANRCSRYTVSVQDHFGPPRRSDTMQPMKCMLIGLFSLAALLSAATGYRILTRYPIPGAGGWDYIAIDSAARRLYVSHATQVDVLDADSGKLFGTIPDTPGVHGAAIASEFNHGFTSNGREDKVTMFDLSTLQVIRKIDVGKGPDGIYYDPGARRVFTNNHGSHDITAI